jgi:uncharacterized protein (DUF885 family)
MEAFDNNRDVQDIAARMFEELARCFPVCSASDEFHYFPQAQSLKKDWSRWDDFSQDAVKVIASKLLVWEEDLAQLAGNLSDQDTLIDISMLYRVAQTIREQLTEVRFHEMQPTLYLTIACVGLADALDQDPAAWEERVRGLPAFLDKARMNLGHIPSLFRDLGLEMARDTRSWLSSIRHIRSGLKPVLGALESFEDHLRQVSTCDNFLLALELLERIVCNHMGCAIGIEEAREELEQEIQETQEIMSKEARRLDPGHSWQKAYKSIPLPSLSEEGLVGLYRDAMLGLGRHCLEQGLVSTDLFSSCPVRVEPVPFYLSAIRSAAAYSIPPGHPPCGGTFFILDIDVPEKLRDVLQPDWRMLTAHETYPGHHLLDASRWNLEKVLRRPIEFPLYYEGWVCFAEELLSHTGYFQGPTDRLLLARRRFWRAVRGKVDLDIQTGMDLFTAACFLEQAGMSKNQSASVVRKYALKPGYQLCYTMGQRRFRDIYERFGKDGPRDFTQKVLALGEIGFDNLEKVLAEMPRPDCLNKIIP